MTEANQPEFPVSEGYAEPPWEGLREVMRMSGPVIVGTLSFMLMQFVDQVMVARLGNAAFAAVGSAGIWAFTFSTFPLGVIGCVGTFVSQSLGRGETQNCARYAWQGMYLALMSGLLALVLWPTAPRIFGMMGHDAALARMEVSYFQVRLLGYAFVGLQSCLTAFFQAVNRPKMAMYATLASNVVNVVLNYALIFGHFGMPRMEVAGAALATVLSLAVNFILLLAMFLSASYDREFGTRRVFQFDLTRTRELLRVGWPAGLSGFMDIANWSLFTSVLVGGIGTVQLAAHVATMEFLHLSFMPALGVHFAVTPIVGQWIGRGDAARAKARAYTALKLCAGYMTTAGVLLAVFAKPLIRTFFTEDPAVIELGQILLIFCAVFQAFDAVNIIMMGALRGAGDTRFMAAMLVLFGYGFFLPLAWLLAWPMGLGAVGAWIGATAYIIGLSGMLFARFHSERWKHIQIFAQDRLQDAGVGNRE